MKAIIEAKFNKEDMIDQPALNDEFDGDMLKAMKWLFKAERMGIFRDENLKLIRIEK